MHDRIFKTKASWITLVCLFGTAMFSSFVSASDKTVLVATAANFRYAGEEIFDQFQNQTGVKVKASYGSTGKLIAQIEHGAPFDVLLSADDLSGQRLKESGLALSDSSFIYAHGRLVLWMPENTSEPLTLESLRLLNVQTLSIANPKTAPYGKAAAQALTKLKTYGLEPKRFLTGQSIAQAFQYVATGNATLGLIALSQVIATEQNQYSWLLIPQNFHLPLKQEALILSNSRNPSSAKLLTDFLSSDTAIKIMHKYGYEDI